MSTSMYPKHQHVEHDSWSTVDSTASENVLPNKVKPTHHHTSSSSSSSMNPLSPPPPPQHPSAVINRIEHQRRRSSSINANQNEQTRQERNPSPEYDSTDDAEQQQHHPPPPPHPPNYMSGITTSRATIETPLEIELSTIAANQPPLSSSAPWMERLSWLQGGTTSSITENEINSNKMGSSSYYFNMGDGIMKTAANATAANNDHGSTNLQNKNIHPVPAYPFRKQASSGFSRVASWFTGRQSDDDNSTLADFDETEWTPPDSSYGAAIPIGGWIPKPIRRMIEGTLIALGIVALVYMVVTTSMRVTNERNRNKHSDGQNNNYLQSGDDYYAYDSNSNYVANGNGVYSDDRYYDGGLYLDDDRYVAYDQGENNEYGDDGEEDEDEESEDGEGGDRL